MGAKRGSGLQREGVKPEYLLTKAEDAAMWLHPKTRRYVTERNGELRNVCKLCVSGGEPDDDDDEE